MPTARGDDPALRRQVVGDLVRKFSEQPVRPRALLRAERSMGTNIDRPAIGAAPKLRAMPKKRAKVRPT